LHGVHSSLIHGLWRQDRDSTTRGSDILQC
jgi:hypothetical protein